MVLEIEKAIKTLEKGGVIIYPSDTIWALGCDATNQNAINKIYKIKNRNKSIPFICLMRDYKMIQKYASINKSIINILKKFKEPTTVVYDKAQNLKTYSDSIGIRIPKESFCNNLLNKFKKPIISTSANKSGDVFPIYFKDINSSILEQVDFTVNLRTNEKLDKASKIIRILKDNSIITLRS